MIKFKVFYQDREDDMPHYLIIYWDNKETLKERFDYCCKTWIEYFNQPSWYNWKFMGAKDITEE